MAHPMTLSRGQRIQVGVITAAAVALFFGIRNLPTGTNLSHMDFRPAGGGLIDMCDPARPQFIPVVRVHSPVTMTLAGRIEGPGKPAQLTATLVTASGKPIAPEDLLVTQTQKVHLLIADRGLTDYQHVHPVPGRKPGDWVFTFTTQGGGPYRIFADFAPAATGLGLYATADLVVPGEPLAASRRTLSWVETREGYTYTLSPETDPVRARQSTVLLLSIQKVGGGRVEVEPVMAAYAHLVAFDEAMSGYAHIHPSQTDLSVAPDPIHPSFAFKVMIPEAGRYVLWAQVQIAGRERFVPFWFDVTRG